MTAHAIDDRFLASILGRWRHMALACVLLGAVGLSGCSKTISSEWREEVRLGDGSLIVIRRVMKYETGKAFAEKGNYVHILDNKYYFPPSSPGGKEVEYDGFKKRNVSTMLLDRSKITGDWLVVETLGECNYSQKTQIYYQKNYVNGAWVQQPSVDKDLYGRDENLSDNDPEGFRSKKLGLITVGNKEEELARTKAELRRDGIAPSGLAIYAGQIGSCNGIYQDKTGDQYGNRN
jgi:hypothetical protein